MALTLTFAQRISKRFGMVLVRVPPEYEGVLKGLKGRIVEVEVGGILFRGRIVEYEGRIYVSLPKRAIALREERGPYHIINIRIR